MYSRWIPRQFKLPTHAHAHYWWVVQFFKLYNDRRWVSHHGGNVFGFSGSPSDATSTGRSYGSQITRNWFWGNPRPNYFQDRGPRDPKQVPWDQKFGLKKFLTSSSNELILWVLWIGYAKNGKNQEKLVIFGHFQCFSLLLRNYAKISSFSWFLPFLA